MKGIIAVPTSSHFYIIKKFALDLMNLRLAFSKLSPDITFLFSECAWIEDARNNIWQRAKKLDPDWILWIDSDMTFVPKDGLLLVERIIKQNYDFVSGLYFAGAQPHMPLIYKEVEQIYNEKTYTGVTYYNNYPRDKSFFEIAGCGFGFCIQSRKVLQNLGERPFNRLSSWFGEELPENNLGEDLSFCRRVKNLGFKIYCDTDVSLGHIRQSVVNEEFLREDKFFKMV